MKKYLNRKGAEAQRALNLVKGERLLTLTRFFHGVSAIICGPRQQNDLMVLFIS